jgi:regulator of sirC expression with transglutaminase-like and TPR domain
LKGNISPVAELFNEDLDEADNAEVIRKLLDTLKSALMEERQSRLHQSWKITKTTIFNLPFILFPTF